MVLWQRLIEVYLKACRQAFSLGKCAGGGRTNVVRKNSAFRRFRLSLGDNIVG